MSTFVEINALSFHMSCLRFERVFIFFCLFCFASRFKNHKDISFAQTFILFDINPFSAKRPFYGTSANSVEPDQTPQSAASDEVL